MCISCFKIKFFEAATQHLSYVYPIINYSHGHTSSIKRKKKLKNEFYSGRSYAQLKLGNSITNWGAGRSNLV